MKVEDDCASCYLGCTSSHPWVIDDLRTSGPHDDEISEKAQVIFGPSCIADPGIGIAFYRADKIHHIIVQRTGMHGWLLSVKYPQGCIADSLSGRLLVSQEMAEEVCLLTAVLRLECFIIPRYSIEYV